MRLRETCVTVGGDGAGRKSIFTRFLKRLWQHEVTGITVRIPPACDV